MAWTKGVSGNPKGRPKRAASITEALRSKLDVEAYAEEMIRVATDPEVPIRERLAVMRDIYNRLEGLPVARSMSARVPVAAVAPDVSKLPPHERALAVVRAAAAKQLAEGEPEETDVIDVEPEHDME